MNGYYKQLIEILKRYGGYFVRNGRGDHEIWSNKEGKHFTVDRGVKKRSTANGVLRDAGINEKI